MATDINAARKRQEERENFIQKTLDELEANTIKFRWYVNEHTPAYNTGGYYDQDIPAKNVRMSDYYDTERAAKKRMSELAPDKGNTLNVQRQRLLRRTWVEWVNH